MAGDISPARVEIGHLGAHDRPRWGELWSEYQTFYGVDIPVDVTQSTWERIQTGRIHALGAFLDAKAQLVGIVHFLFHEDTWSKAPACYLQDLYVDPRARRSGCARQLYDLVGKNHGFIQYAYLGARH